MSRSLGKKLRFEVFKRDSFQCQYCGATPPKVILHVDHIKPVADGGSNAMDNLVTSCQPCNAGKGKRNLSSVPESLRQKALRIKEAEDQILGYQEILEAKEKRLEEETWKIVDLLFSKDEVVPKRDYYSVRNFISKLGYFEVKDAAEIADQKPWGTDRRFKYFCGICINKQKRGEE